jgi:hypothetical protein
MEDTDDVLIREELKSAAYAGGARWESLPELALLLKRRVQVRRGVWSRSFTVLTESGAPAVNVDGSPVTVDQLVKSYLRDHHHHVQPVRQK